MVWETLYDRRRWAPATPLTLTKEWITFAKLGLSGWGTYPSGGALYVHQHHVQYITRERNPWSFGRLTSFQLIYPIVPPIGRGATDIERRITRKRHVARALRRLAGRIRFSDDIVSVIPSGSSVSISTTKNENCFNENRGKVKTTVGAHRDIIEVMRMRKYWYFSSKHPLFLFLFLSVFLVYKLFICIRYV